MFRPSTTRAMLDGKGHCCPIHLQLTLDPRRLPRLELRRRPGHGHRDGEGRRDGRESDGGGGGGRSGGRPLPGHRAGDRRGRRTPMPSSSNSTSAAGTSPSLAELDLHSRSAPPRLRRPRDRPSRLIHPLIAPGNVDRDDPPDSAPQQRRCARGDSSRGWMVGCDHAFPDSIVSYIMVFELTKLRTLREAQGRPLPSKGRQPCSTQRHDRGRSIGVYY